MVNRKIERELNDVERLSNLHLIDSILFYCKLMILQLRLRYQHPKENNLTETVKKIYRIPPRYFTNVTIIDYVILTLGDVKGVGNYMRR